MPVELKKALDDGRHVIANGSRAVIPLLVGRLDLLVVIEVNTPAQLLAQRIAARGRESAAEIEARLARAVSAPPAGVTVIEVLNDSTSAVGIERFLAAIQEGVALLERSRRASPRAPTPTARSWPARRSTRRHMPP